MIDASKDTRTQTDIGFELPSLTEAALFSAAGLALFAGLFVVAASVMSGAREARTKLADREVQLQPYAAKVESPAAAKRLASAEPPSR